MLEIINDSKLDPDSSVGILHLIWIGAKQHLASFQDYFVRKQVGTR